MEQLNLFGEVPLEALGSIPTAPGRIPADVVQILCRQCDEPFEPEHFNQRVCSRTCRRLRNNAIMRDVMARGGEDLRARRSGYEYRRTNATREAQERTRRRMRNQNLKQYGISLLQYEEMVAIRCGLCDICGQIEYAPGGLRVDHDHVTGRVRGLLCDRCNLGLGHLYDRSDLLEAALAYLREDAVA